MATTNNSKFLATGTKEQNISQGWQIRILDYKDFTTLVAVCDQFNEFSFTQELNGTGTGSITIDDDNPWWGFQLENGLNRRTLEKRQYVFEAWDNGTPRFAWLGQVVTNQVIGEDETKAVTISGPGIAQVLTWAKIYRPGWPTKVPIISHKTSPGLPGVSTAVYRATSANDKLPAFNWGFPPAWSTMRMWYTVFKAAQRRGLLSWVNPMFTATKDSAKKDFKLVRTQLSVAGEEYQPGNQDEHLLDFLNECTGQETSTWFGQPLEWMMYPGFKLDVRTTIGADRSKTVRFFPTLVLNDQRDRDRENIYNRITVYDVVSNETVRTDKSSVGVWNLREQWNTTTKNITDPTLRAGIADRLLAQQKDEKESYTIKIPYDSLGRVPYRNFFVGDYVGFNIDDLGYTGAATEVPAKMRVKAITISVTGDSPIPECEITLQDAFESRQDQLARQITKLVNEPPPKTLSQLTDVSSTVSSAADGSTLVYDATTKTWVAASGSGGNRVFFGTVDPSTTQTVSTGDFWIQTS